MSETWVYTLSSPNVMLVVLPLLRPVCLRPVSLVVVTGGPIAHREQTTTGGVNCEHSCPLHASHTFPLGGAGGRRPKWHLPACTAVVGR